MRTGEASRGGRRLSGLASGLRPGSLPGPELEGAVGRIAAAVGRFLRHEPGTGAEQTRRDRGADSGEPGAARRAQRGRCRPSAGARLRRGNRGSAPARLDGSGRCWLRTWWSLSPVGLPPVAVKGFGWLAVERSRRSGGRGDCRLAGSPRGMTAIGTFQAVMHWVVLSIRPRLRGACPDSAAACAGQTKTPDLV